MTGKQKARVIKGRDPEVRNMEGKINIKVPSTRDASDPIWSTDYIDNEDFVSSYTIKKNYNNIKA